MIGIEIHKDDKSFFSNNVKRLITYSIKQPRYILSKEKNLATSTRTFKLCYTGETNGLENSFNTPSLKRRRKRGEKIHTYLN
ncbi:hypothetical protein CDL12_05176 [Handroanthus impetiginosus]|uniref:Uncharacterized protein n=1 Tax=Handroanthus impetiginosus TaxID=429701 RepID=A0A2G9HX99_9LAMI|nr:hypothetical protein CDL12_05176 [Handroanthus impetiginosus]